MNPRTIRFAACAVSTSLLFSACNGLTPEENGTAAGVGAGILAGGIGAAAGLRPGQAALLGAGVGALTGIIVYSVAKHQADERQRQIAERNARRAYAAHQAELRRKRVRYIAVQTSRTKESTGSTSCMVWDTQNEQLVGNTVYDTKNTPPQGSTAKFDNYSAEYVGS